MAKETSIFNWAKCQDEQLKNKESKWWILVMAANHNPPAFDFEKLPGGTNAVRGYQDGILKMAAEKGVTLTLQDIKAAKRAIKNEKGEWVLGKKDPSETTTKKTNIFTSFTTIRTPEELTAAQTNLAELKQKADDAHNAYKAAKAVIDTYESAVASAMEMLKAQGWKAPKENKSEAA